MGPRAFSTEDLRVARVAQEALRALLGRGEVPTPDAFSRAYHEALGTPAEASASSGPSREEQRPVSAAEAHLVRRLSALLSSALAALGTALPPERPESAQCVEVASRLLVASKPALVADEVERLLTSLPHARGAASVSVSPPPPWREVCLEALRHIVTLLPAESESATAVQSVRQSLARARNADEYESLERALRILRRTVLAD